MRRLTILMSAVIFILASTVSAQVTLYQTDFENPPFSVGDLVGQDGWVNHSGSGSLIQVIAGQAAQLVQGGGSREDASVALGATMVAGAVFEFSFDVIVNGTAPATMIYFAHFKDAGTGFNARIFVAPPNVGTNDFTFAIGETSSTTPAATFATDFSFGQSYTLSGSYSFDTGISTLSVDGGTAIDSTIQADPGQGMLAFAFRQSGGNTSMDIDNLLVTANPLPVELMSFSVE